MKKHTGENPISILVISPFFYPHIGGSQRYIEELYVHVIKQHPNVHVTVLTYNTDAVSSTEQYRGLHIYRIPCFQILPGQFALPNPFALFSLLFRLSTKQFDVVHTHIRFFDSTWWAWLYANIIGAKSIFTEHVATHPVHQKKIVEQIAKLVDMTIAKFAIGRYTLVTTTNTPAKQFLEKTLGITRPIVVSYGGVDTTFFSPSKIPTKKSIPGVMRPFPKDTIIISYIGRLIWSKGVTYLLSAIKRLDKVLPKNVIFILGGSGELFHFLKRDISRLHLSKRAFLTGPMDAVAVRNTLQATNIFIHPSHHNEGFPNSILEAASSGTCVIATDNAGTSEIITNKKTGLLIKQKSNKVIENALLWILAHPKKQKAMAQAAQIHTKQTFDWTIVAKTFYTYIIETCK